MPQVPRLLLLLVVPSLVLAGCTAEESPGAAAGNTGDTSAPASGATMEPVAETPEAPAAAPATPAQVEVVRLAVDQGRVAPDERFIATATLRNLGGTEGAGSVTLRVDGAPHATEAFRVAPGGTTNLTFALQSSQTGTRSLALDAVGADVLAAPVTVDVVAAGAFSFHDLALLPRVVELGDVSVLTVTVANDGATDASGTLRVAMPDGSVLASAPVELAPGASARVPLQVRPDAGGVIPLVVSMSSSTVTATTNITVRAPQLANPAGAFNDGMCDTYLGYTLSFDNLGDGVARQVVLTAIVTTPDGAEHSRWSSEPQDVVAGQRAAIGVAPPIQQRCGADDVYDLRIVVELAHTDGFEYDAGRFTV